MRILLVTDDPKTADAVVKAVTLAGYLIDHESDGQKSCFKDGTATYAAAILDLTSPTMDGLSILRHWRHTTMAFPVLILTARESLVDHVAGINAGADDYLPKPFHSQDLVDRLRIVMRRRAEQESPVLTIGAVSLDTQQMLVNVKGNAIHLSPKEYRLVSYLMYHAGRVASRIELAKLLYASDSEPESKAVTVLVARIRRKLGVDLIKTRWGFGYVIEAPES